MVNFIKKYSWIILFIIIVVGVILRIYNVNHIPTGPIAVEMDVYNSIHSIATTGHDVDGKLLAYLYQPNCRRNAPIYGIVEFFTTQIFGNNTFGLRLPAVIFGTLAIPLMYYLSLLLFKRKNIAIVAALFQCIAPVFIHFSRIAWAPATEVPLIIFNVLILLMAFKDDKINTRYLFISVFLSGMMSYAYIGSLTYAFILAVSIFAFYYKKVIVDYKKVLLSLIMLFVISIPALWVFFFEPLTNNDIQYILTFKDGINLTSIMIFIHNYFAHFNWSFLATDGYSIPGLTWLYLNGFGAFYWWIILLACIGLINCFKNWNKIYGFLLIVWVLIYPLGGSLTNEGAPNGARTLIGFPVFVLLAALGFSVILEFIKNKNIKIMTYVLVLILSIASGYNFSNFYFNHSIHQNSNAWESGVDSTFTVVKQNLTGKKRICFAASWASVPSFFQYYLSDVNIEKYDNIDFPECFLPHTILVTSPGNTDDRKGFNLKVPIYDVDGNTVAYVRVSD